VLEALGAVVAVGEPHAAALLPGMVAGAHARRVLGRPVAAVLVARVLAPAVVDHHVRLHARLVEEPREQLGAAPLGRGQVPLAVREDERRLVARDEVLELRERVLPDEARLVGEVERVVPLVERVVVAHLEAPGPDGAREIPEQVALRTDLDRVPGTAPGRRRLAARPQREALVVLRCQHDVSRARAEEDVGPVVGVEQLRAELRGEIRIGEVGTVLPPVVLPRAGLDRVRAGALPARERVPVPLGVCELARDHGGVGGHGVHAPVDEDAEPRLGEPGRRGAAVDRLPGGLVGLRAGEGGPAEGGAEKQESHHGRQAV
jgi:hypothetical protein